jgi:hypothetical protein
LADTTTTFCKVGSERRPVARVLPVGVDVVSESVEVEQRLHKG